MKPKLATILGPKSKTLFTPAAVTSAGQMSWASDLQNSKLKERMVTSHQRSAPTFLWTTFQNAWVSSSKPKVRRMVCGLGDVD